VRRLQAAKKRNSLHIMCRDVHPYWARCARGEGVNQVL